MITLPTNESEPENEEPSWPHMPVKIGDCKHGKFVYFPHDMYVGRGLDIYGEYSEPEIEVFKKVITPGSVVVEVGANLGSHTVPLAKMVGKGRIFAYEPQRLVFQQLCANLAMNGIANVWARQQAVGFSVNKVGPPPVDYRQFGNFSGLRMSPDAPDPVDVIKLDDQPEIRRFVDFIKLDAEGMDVDVLKGAYQTIKERRPVLFVENDKAWQSEELVGLIRVLGYDLYWHTCLMFNANNFRGVKENVYEGACSFNMLCFPTELHVKIVGLTPVTDAVHPILARAMSKQ